MFNNVSSRSSQGVMANQGMPQLYFYASVSCSKRDILIISLFPASESNVGVVEIYTKQNRAGKLDFLDYSGHESLLSKDRENTIQSCSKLSIYSTMVIWANSHKENKADFEETRSIIPLITYDLGWLNILNTVLKVYCLIGVWRRL